jgi:hypothetical protein
MRLTQTTNMDYKKKNNNGNTKYGSSCGTTPTLKKTRKL